MSWWAWLIIGVVVWFVVVFSLVLGSAFRASRGVRRELKKFRDLEPGDLINLGPRRRPRI